jgi:uncharacterized phiE125 gp8 family phage protein
MALTKITDAAVEPVTLAEAKAHLRVDAADEDAYITALITVARTAAEERMQRTLMNTSWRLMLDFFPDAIRLPMPRIVAVSSVQYVDPDGALQTLDPSGYSVDSASEPGWIVPAWGLDWPDARGQVNAVSVLYTAGYGAYPALVPAPIRQWILLAIGEMYAARERSADKPMVPHQFVDGLLDTYRVLAV